MLNFFILHIALVATALAGKILLPNPQGPYNVFIRTSEIRDTSRSDGNYPNDNPNKPRRLMVSAFTPTQRATPSCRSPYMFESVSEFLYNYYSDDLNTTVDFTRYVLPLCSEDVTYAVGEGCGGYQQYNVPAKFPLVLFSPGYGVSRFAYNVICSSLASQGFTVLSIDHPYSTGVVEFPDGTILTQKVTNDNQISPPLIHHDFKVRFRDVLTVLNAITSNVTLTSLLFPEVQPDFEKIAMWGHSFGGAATAEAMYKDERILGGINLDGRMFGSVTHHGFDRPFILWQSIDGASRKTEPSWRRFWRRLTGFKKNFGVEHAQHFSYTDFELLGDLYPFKAPGLLGKIDGTRDIEILTTYSNDFFQWVLNGKEPTYITGPNAEFPEVFFNP